MKASPAQPFKIEEAYNFLTHHLIPHAQAEDKALYPMVQKAMGSTQATATMSRDHVEVGRLTEELGTLRVHSTQLSITFDQARALRRVLYGLYTVNCILPRKKKYTCPCLTQN
jgi:iron-sulfur cluster repair protein YtfE (RIC family)